MNINSNETGEAAQTERDFTGFLALVYGKLLRPFEELFRGELTNLQIMTLCALGRSGPTSVTELAHRLHMPKQQMTKVLSKLSDEGYVCRYSHDSDKRIVLVALTESTISLLDEKREQFFQAMQTNVAQQEHISCVSDLNESIDRLWWSLESIPANISSFHAEASGRAVK